MTDETKVVSLEEFKKEKELTQGQEAHEVGGAFMFELFELDDGLLPNGVGLTDCPEHPICILLDKVALTGISFSVKTAERLIEDLQGAVKEVKEQSSPKEGA